MVRLSLCYAATVVLFWVSYSPVQSLMNEDALFLCCDNTVPQSVVKSGFVLTNVETSPHLPPHRHHTNSYISVGKLGSVTIQKNKNKKKTLNTVV